MTAPLRPLTTGELLDRTFNLYRNNFILFAGISALAALTFVAALLFLQFLGFDVPTPGPDVDPRAALGAFAIYFGVIIIFYVLGASLAMGATILAVSKVHLGQLGNIRESYRKILSRIGRIILLVLAIVLRMLGMFVLAYLAMIPIGVLLGLIVSAAGPGSTMASVLIIIFGFAILIVVSALITRVYLKYSLAIQACLLENMRVNESLRRSAFLSRGSLWRIFLVLLLTNMIFFALDYVLHWPVDVFFRNPSIVALVWEYSATFVAYTASFPITTIAVALLYYDQRVRKEAFDLQLMMESLENKSDQAAAAPIG